MLDNTRSALILSLAALLAAVPFQIGQSSGSPAVHVAAALARGQGNGPPEGAGASGAAPGHDVTASSHDMGATASGNLTAAAATSTETTGREKAGAVLGTTTASQTGINAVSGVTASLDEDTSEVEDETDAETDETVE